MSRAKRWNRAVQFAMFSKENEELVNKLFRCFPPGLVRAFCSTLIVEPLKPSKLKIIMKPSTRGHEVAGIIMDHVLSVARKVGIPQTYIGRVSRTRRSLRLLRKDCGDSKYARTRQTDLHLSTFDLIDAIVEISERK